MSVMTPHPPVYTPERIEIESRWMRCSHASGFSDRGDYFNPFEMCIDCNMPRKEGALVRIVSVSRNEDGSLEYTCAFWTPQPISTLEPPPKKEED